MQDDGELTFGMLVGDWFIENMPREWAWSQSTQFREIYTIRCRCHEDDARSLAVVLDRELVARIFTYPLSNPPKLDWIVINAADPDFFKKFKTGLESAHEQRYGSAIERYSQ